MNKTNASKWIELGSAMIQGKTIQRNEKGEWLDVLNLNTISYDPESFRIKPEPKKDWARLALLKDEKEYFSGRADKDMGESEDEIIKGLEDLYCAHFIRWLTDRIEYIIPEGDA